MTHNVQKANPQGWSQLGANLAPATQGHSWILCATEAAFPTAMNMQQCEMAIRLHLPGVTIIGTPGYPKNGLAFLCSPDLAKSIVDPAPSTLPTTDEQHWRHLRLKDVHPRDTSPSSEFTAHSLAAVPKRKLHTIVSISSTHRTFGYAWEISTAPVWLQTLAARGLCAP